MRKLTLSLGCLAAAALALTGCQSSEPDSVESAPSVNAPVVEGAPIGEQIVLKNMGKSIQVEIRASAEEAQIAVMGSLEDRAEAEALEARLDQAGSLSAAYALVTGKTADAAPEVLRSLDLKVAANGASSKPVILGGETAPMQPLQKGAAADPDQTWNWSADWTWFKGLQTGGECFFEDRDTRQVSVAAWSIDHKVIVMAPSHVYGSQYTPAYWNGSVWVAGSTVTISPRYFHSYRYTSAHGTFRMFSNNGLGGSSWRAYIDVIWRRYNNSCVY